MEGKNWLLSIFTSGGLVVLFWYFICSSKNYSDALGLSYRSS